MDVRAPSATALMRAYTYLPGFEEMWPELTPEDRLAYDQWVAGARLHSQARRRAHTVWRRMTMGRGYAGPVRRRADALIDLWRLPRRGPGGGPGRLHDLGAGPSGWQS